jgi:glutathione synthase/RimK-type ligase-like ATP-grasp enzyme
MLIAKSKRKILQDDNIVGMLINKNESAIKAFSERSRVARRLGITLVALEQTRENISRLNSGNPMNCLQWDDYALMEIETECPNACYDRSNISYRTNGKSMRSDLISRMMQRNVHFVNSPAFRIACTDKWSTYKLFKEHDIYTPHTELFTGKGLEEFINEFGLVFIKKRRSSGGKGQIVIERKGRGYTVNYGKKERCSLRSIEEVIQFARELNVSAKTHILQEGIYSKTVKGRVSDLRAVFQRGDRGLLEMTCMYLRVGAPKSKQSNIHKKGHAQEPFVVFRDDPRLDEKHVRQTGSRIIESASTAYTIGETAIDFILSEDDNEDRLCCLEINSRPGSQGIRALRKIIPQDRIYLKKGIIPFPYDNDIRRAWGDKLRSFVENPIRYASYLSRISVDHALFARSKKKQQFE